MGVERRSNRTRTTVESKLRERVALSAALAEGLRSPSVRSLSVRLPGDRLRGDYTRRIGYVAADEGPPTTRAAATTAVV